LLGLSQRLFLLLALLFPLLGLKFPRLRQATAVLLLLASGLPLGVGVALGDGLFVGGLFLLPGAALLLPLPFQFLAALLFFLGVAFEAVVILSEQLAQRLLSDVA